jgi:hypothetical protein
MKESRKRLLRFHKRRKHFKSGIVSEINYVYYETDLFTLNHYYGNTFYL